LSDFSETPVFRLSKPATPETLELLRASVERSLEDGVRSMIVDIDDLIVLDAPVISSLIGLLRTVRAGGALVSLRASRTSILDTLRLTALDKVFTVVTVAPAAQPVAKAPAAKRGFGRRVASLIALGALGAFALAPAGRASASDATATPERLISAVIAQNAYVSSYRAHVSVDFKLRSFPYLTQHLDGTTYYKKPDNFEVVFNNVPSYAKGFDKLYSDIDDPSSWARRFDLSLVGEKKFGDHSDVVIRLVQKVRGMIDHEDVAIDPERSHIDAMEWYYYNGGTIAMTQEFARIGSCDVLAKQHATIHIPFVHAAADASYTNYETGIAIDDAVFTGPRK
jgi:anti-anti-sigma regulatory factor